MCITEVCTDIQARIRVITRVIMMKLMAKKLQLPNEVVSKAMEYQRLAAMKCSDLLKQYSDNCICVICLQLAASHSVGIQFDKVNVTNYIIMYLYQCKPHDHMKVGICTLLNSLLSCIDMVCSLAVQTSFVLVRKKYQSALRDYARCIIIYYRL